MNNRGKLLVLITVIATIIGISLLVLAFRKEAAAPGRDTGTGQQVTLVGDFVCLPHRNTEGPQTMECAFGIKTDDNVYYALRDTTSDYSLLGTLGTDKRIEATGTLEQKEDETYQSSGLFWVTSVETR